MIEELRAAGYTWNEVAKKTNSNLTGEQLRKKTNRNKFKTTKRWQVLQDGKPIWLESQEATVSVEEKDFDFSKVVPFEYTTVTRQADDNIANVYLSDVHIGCDTGESIQSLTESFIDNIRHLDNLHNISTFNLFVLGDTVDGYNGYTTRGGHKLEQDLDTKSQFDYFQTMFSTIVKFITEDLGSSMTINFITNSNHGGDFEYICAKAFSNYCNKVYTRCEARVYSEIYNKFRINNKLFVFTHGKDDKYMKRGLPFQLNDATEIMLIKEIGDISEYEDIYLIKGDLHRSNVNYGSFLIYRNIMKFNGNSNWERYNFGLRYDKGFEVDIINGSIVSSLRIKI